MAAVDDSKPTVLVTGAGGFIGSHLAKKLKAEGHFVRGVDWKENEFMENDTFCNEFLLLDLRCSLCSAAKSALIPVVRQGH